MAQTGKVTVVGAGAQGAAIAGRIAESDTAGLVVLADVVDGRAEALALDLNQCRALTGHETLAVGIATSPEGEGYELTAGSDLVVIAAGRRPTPDGDRFTHLRANLELVTGLARQVALHSPDAVLLMASNPVAELTRAVQQAAGFPASRVIGQSPALDSARFAHFLAEELEVEVARVRALTLGWHGEDMLTAVSACTVDGRPLGELLSSGVLEDLAERTRYAGTELTALLRGSAVLRAPAAAAAALARAVLTDSGAVLPVCAFVDGEFGLEGVWLGVEAELGARGVNKVVETRLAPDELAALRLAAEGARASQRRADALGAEIS
ncbi:hypothetical protein OG455_11105 [Kitasatospora sp. NBC_01287]|uniref:lactate/malate family dehydrogenase n=1 Tax=Kitasatospora sp. NBC_01287 TaxID=2903573 RepID=UPI00225500CE|nr:hypothetical protein [Kitasatospora sp. NBC_01287]MCX4746062.1 hypothetical protein [Kitasatospora sp. NBC_01287]